MKSLISFSGKSWKMLSICGLLNLPKACCGKVANLLIFSMLPIRTAADDTFDFFIFQRNVLTCQADDSHEMSRLMKKKVSLK